MLQRDLLMVAATAIISSSLTYLLVEKRITETPAKLVAVATSEATDAHLSNPDDKPAHNGVNTSAVPGISKSGLSHEKNSPAKDISHEQEAVLRFGKQEELKAKFADFFVKQDNMNPSNMNAKIETRFYQEEWDQEWANSRESNILSLFEADENLRDIPPLQVTCRSKNCQVVLSATNQDEVRLLSENFMRIAMGSDIGIQDKVISFFPDISTGRLVFYLSENGNMDLFQ